MQAPETERHHGPSTTRFAWVRGQASSASHCALRACAQLEFSLAAVAEQNSNGTGLNDRRRPQNFARPAAAALPNGWPFPGDFQLLSNK